MFNLSDFPDNLSNDLILQDSTWQYATVCELSTNSIFWNRAAIITLSKECTTDASSAIIYLLQKQAKTLDLWKQEWGDDMPTIGEFLRCLLVWGRFTNTTGFVIPIEKFWKSYNATINGIISQPSFEYSEDGIIKPYSERLVKEEINQVICFDDTWNEQNFFIETSAEWILFNWCTMA